MVARSKRRALAVRRALLGYTQESLAEVVGVDVTTVGRWERGRLSPQPFFRRKLAKALEVSLEELNTLLAETREALLAERRHTEFADGQFTDGQFTDGQFAEGQPAEGQPAEGQPAEGQPGEGQPGGGQPTGGQLSDSAPQAGELPAAESFDDRVLSAPWTARGTVEAAVLLGGGGPVKRRVFGWVSGLALTAPAHQWLVQDPGPLVSALSGRRVPAGLVDRLIGMVAELRRMDDVAGGGTVLGLARQEFDVVAGLLDRAIYDEPTGRALHVLLAELGQLCGWTAYDGGDHPLAQRYWIAGLRATHSADERVLGARILGGLAEQAARHGQPAEAVTLIESAVAGTRGRHTPALLAMLYGKQAYAAATLGDAAGCAAANAKLCTQIERLGSAEEPSYLYWVNRASMTGEVGNALRQLGQAEQAVAVLTEALALFDDAQPRSGLGYRIHLAKTLTMPGKQQDLEAAAARGLEAIQLVQTLDSPRSLALIGDLGHQLTPHTTLPAVHDFLTQARELTPA